MALYLTKEQGGSVFNVLSGGSLNVAAGGKLTVAGDLNVSGTLTNSGATTVPSAGTFAVSSGGSITVADGGGFSIGNVGISTGKNAPAAAASPGAVYIRTDGSMSNLYINISSGTTGSVWRSACIVN